MLWSGSQCAGPADLLLDIDARLGYSDLSVSRVSTLSLLFREQRCDVTRALRAGETRGSRVRYFSSFLFRLILNFSGFLCAWLGPETAEDMCARGKGDEFKYTKNKSKETPKGENEEPGTNRRNCRTS